MTKITKNCCITQPMAEYLGQNCTRLSMSSSDAQTLANLTPAHLQARWNEKPERERRAEFGTALHALVLEPFRASKQIVVIDAENYRTKEAQKAGDAALASGLTPMLAVDMPRLQDAVARVRSHPTVAGLMAAEGSAEQSYFAFDDDLAIVRKARPDLVTGAGVMLEFKSVGSCEEMFLRRRIDQGGWYQQAPFHADVFRRVVGEMPADYLWVCIEQKPPHEIRVVRPSAAALAAGHVRNEQAAKVFAACARTDSWPGYPTGIIELGLPDWAHYRLEEENLDRENGGMEAARIANETGGHPFG